MEFPTSMIRAHRGREKSGIGEMDRRPRMEAPMPPRLLSRGSWTPGWGTELVTAAP